jgi:hypothetical protein
MITTAVTVIDIKTDFVREWPIDLQIEQLDILLPAEREDLGVVVQRERRIEVEIHLSPETADDKGDERHHQQAQQHEQVGRQQRIGPRGFGPVEESGYAPP